MNKGMIEDMQNQIDLLTIERDQQRKLKMILVERVINAEANCSVYRVRIADLQEQAKKLQEIIESK